jgi:hypothetical protein
LATMWRCERAFVLSAVQGETAELERLLGMKLQPAGRTELAFGDDERGMSCLLGPAVCCSPWNMTHGELDLAESRVGLDRPSHRQRNGIRRVTW